MSMTKKEREAFDAMERELARAKAFHFTAPVKRDLPPPDSYADELTRGWDFNDHTLATFKCCSSSIGHGRESWEKTSSQHPRALYSTELLALRAMRTVMELRYANALAAVDKRITELAAE